MREEKGIRVADETWIAAALLHREHPEREDFAVADIVERAQRENLAGRLRPGVQLHASQHCVANKPPRPADLRMLLETTRGRRRLFREGDPAHPRRSGKIVPRREEIPEAYHELLDWYADEYAHRANALKGDPILSLRGLGRAIWVAEEADAYVRRLRKGWE